MVTKVLPMCADVTQILKLLNIGLQRHHDKTQSIAPVLATMAL